MQDSKWYTNKDFYYFQFETEDKLHVYFDDNLDIVMFWIRQIQTAMKFHEWY